MHKSCRQGREDARAHMYAFSALDRLRVYRYVYGRVQVPEGGDMCLKGGRAGAPVGSLSSSCRTQHKLSGPPAYVRSCRSSCFFVCDVWCLAGHGRRRAPHGLRGKKREGSDRQRRVRVDVREGEGENKEGVYYVTLSKGRRGRGEWTQMATQPGFSAR